MKASALSFDNGSQCKYRLGGYRRWGCMSFLAIISVLHHPISHETSLDLLTFRNISLLIVIRLLLIIYFFILYCVPHPLSCNWFIFFTTIATPSLPNFLTAFGIDKLASTGTVYWSANLFRQSLLLGLKLYRCVWSIVLSCLISESSLIIFLFQISGLDDHLIFGCISDFLWLYGSFCPHILDSDFSWWFSFTLFWSLPYNLFWSLFSPGD